jgi:hypothetical protein
MGDIAPYTKPMTPQKHRLPVTVVAGVCATTVTDRAAGADDRYELDPWNTMPFGFGACCCSSPVARTVTKPNSDIHPDWRRFCSFLLQKR